MNDIVLACSKGEFPDVRTFQCQNLEILSPIALYHSPLAVPDPHMCSSLLDTMWRSSGPLAKSLRVLRRSRPSPKLSLGLLSSNLRPYNTTDATIKQNIHHVRENPCHTTDTGSASDIGTSKTTEEPEHFGLYMTIFALVFFTPWVWLWCEKHKPIIHSNCSICDFQSVLKPDPSNVLEYTQQLHHTLRLLMTSNPQAQQSIDAAFQVISAMRQKYRPKYDNILKRLARELLEADKSRDRGNMTRHCLDRASKDVDLLRDTVVSEFQAKYPKLKDSIDGFRNGVALACSPERKKHIWDLIPDGHQVMMLLAKLVLLPAPVKETLEEIRYKNKLSQADRQLKQYLGS